VDYEENKKTQEQCINFHKKYHDEMCKKYDVINEMGCTIFTPDGKIKFTSDSFMTEIHYLKTWYDTLFYRNKVDIIRLVAKDYGYKINEMDWDPLIKFGSSLKAQLKLKKEEIIELSKKIHRGDETEPQYKYYIDNLKEQIRGREKYLKGITDIVLYEELACDQEKFTNWLYKKYMDLDKIEFKKKQMELNNNEITQVVKDNDLFNKINSCFWLEQTLNFSKYKITDIKCNDIEAVKKIFIKNIDKFYDIFKNNACKERIIKLLKNKINSINDLNLLQKFVADCYNGIIENIIKVEYKRKNISKNKKIGYYFFEKV